MLKITFQLFAHHAAAFDQFAEAHGGRSALVRWMVGELLAGRLSPPSGEKAAAVTPTRHNLVEIDLSQPEAKALDQACAARGMSRSRWIHALVRCRLGAPNAFSKSDRVVLRQTSRSLKTLASDVRRLQMESKLNKSPPAQTARLAAIESSMERLAKSIRTAVDDSELYWGIKERQEICAEEPPDHVADA